MRMHPTHWQSLQRPDPHFRNSGERNLCPLFCSVSYNLLVDEGKESEGSEGVRYLVRITRYDVPVGLPNYHQSKLQAKFARAYGPTMADEIIHEYALDMTDAYLALPIKQVLAKGTDTTLIYVVYSATKSLFIRYSVQQGMHKLIKNIHMVI